MFDPDEILTFTDADWISNFNLSDTWEARKGKAIDAYVRRHISGGGTRYGPFDLDNTGLIDGVRYHEIKSAKGVWPTLSFGEIEHAEHALERGEDSAIWLFKQLKLKHEFRFIGIFKYSVLKANKLLVPTHRPSPHMEKDGSISFRFGKFFTISHAMPFALK